MYSRFPLSMENIPRQSGFGCLSLKFGSILSALIIILYSVFALAQCFAALGSLPIHFDPHDVEVIMTYGLIVGVSIIHAFTLFLSAVMLVGTLREKLSLIKPWIIWTSIQVTAFTLLFIFSTTMNMINHFADTSLVLFVTEFLGLLVRFYMLMIIASYYKKLEEERDESARLSKLINKDSSYYSVA